MCMGLVHAPEAYVWKAPQKIELMRGDDQKMRTSTLHKKITFFFAGGQQVGCNVKTLGNIICNSSGVQNFITKPIINFGTPYLFCLNQKAIKRTKFWTKRQSRDPVGIGIDQRFVYGHATQHFDSTSAGKEILNNFSA